MSDDYDLMSCLWHRFLPPYGSWVDLLIMIPERRFVRFLIERRFVYRTASGNVLPYANVKNTGLFCVKDYCNHGHIGSYTLVTPQGKLYFAQLREMILLVS